MQQAQGHSTNWTFVPKGALQSVESTSEKCLGYEPFGSLLPGRNYSSSSYRYGLNGQEKDDEIYGATGTSYTAEFWQYDPRLGRRWNLDPKPLRFASDYSVFRNNPIWLNDVKGDSSVFDTKGNKVHYDPNDKDLRVFMQDGDNFSQIGELGKSIDVDVIMANVTQENRAAAKDMDIFDWKNKVQQDGDWDLKNNQATIFGVAWHYDLSTQSERRGDRTDFTTAKLRFSSAADVGNFHAGYTGTHAGIPVALQWLGAGVVEKIKNVGEGDWKSFFGNKMDGIPFGDKMADWLYNTIGMGQALDEQKAK